MADYNEPYLTLRLTGLNYDTPAYDLPLDVWSEGQNVRFQDGATEKMEGHEPVFGTLGTAPNWMLPVGYGANYYWIYASTTAVYVTDMASHYNITPTTTPTGDIDTNWNGGLINNYAVLNNGANPPIWWDGATSNICTALPGWTSGETAKVIRPYKNFLIAMNISDSGGDYPDMVHWSDAAPTGSVPASWDETDVTGDAGKTELSDTPGELIDGAALGDQFIIYKRTATYTMQYVGGQYIFQFRKLFGNIGIMAANCVQEFNNKHLILTKDDVMVHDGASAPVSILTTRMRTWMFNAINNDYYHRSFILPRHARREMWVCVPTGSSEYADIALIWNYEENTLGLRELPLPRYGAAGIVDPSEATDWDSDSEAWDDDTTLWGQATFSATAYSAVIGDRTELLEVDKTDAFDGTAPLAYVSRESMPLIDRRSIKLVKALYPNMSSSGNPTVRFRVGFQMYPTDAVTWGSLQDFVVGVDDKVDVLGKGRYVSLRCESEIDANWKLHSLDLEIEKVERF